MKHRRLVILIALAAAARVAAVEISPDPLGPYTYNPSLAPLPNYGFGVLKCADFSGKLIDDRYGDMIPGISLAAADPSNWVEFGGTGEMTFHFQGNPTIQNIVLSMANWNAAAIYLPDFVQVNGATVTYSGTFPGLDRAFISLDGNWTGNDLVLHLQDSGNRYMFIDEVSFYSTTGEGLQAVPEPSTYALLAGLGVLGVALSRRRKS